MTEDAKWKVLLEEDMHSSVTKCVHINPSSKEEGLIGQQFADKMIVQHPSETRKNF